MLRIRGEGGCRLRVPSSDIIWDGGVEIKLCSAENEARALLGSPSAAPAAQGFQRPPSLSWLPDGAAHPDGYPAPPTAAEDPSTGPKQTLVTLESPQQQQQPAVVATGAGELPSELVGQSSAHASGQLLMPVEQEDSGPGRPSADAEATQMELSPAPTISKWPQASPSSRRHSLHVWLHISSFRLGLSRLLQASRRSQ